MSFALVIPLQWSLERIPMSWKWAPPSQEICLSRTGTHIPHEKVARSNTVNDPAVVLSTSPLSCGVQVRVAVSGSVPANTAAHSLVADPPPLAVTPPGASVRAAYGDVGV